jgi:nitroreductase
MQTIKRALPVFFLIPLLCGCNGETNTNADTHVLSILTETRTTQYFSDESVPLEDITKILDAGRSASSGRNMQPWYFGAIINQEVIKEIASKIKMGPPPPGPRPDTNRPARPAPYSSAFPKARFADAPAAIAIACNKRGGFEAGLACENMVIAAVSLGYGAKIVAGGAAQLNDAENRQLLQIPEDMSVMAILLLGKPDSTIDMTADGVTGASTRKPLSEVSSIVE